MTQVGNCTDCEDSTVSPKRIMAHTAKNRVQFMDELIDPIGEEIKDPDAIGVSYAMLPLVPFFQGNDSFLRFLNRLRLVSPTHGSIIESIREHTLGKGFVLNYRREPGFVRKGDTEEVSDAEFNRYVEWLRQWGRGDELLSEIANLIQNYLSSGNAYLEVVLSEVAGERYASIYSHDFMQCRYIATRPGEDKIVALSKAWDWGYLTKYPPELVNVYPNFTQMEDGTLRTIIHLKNREAGYQWYGLPPSISALYHMYMEYQQGDYTVDALANRFVGDVFMELEGDPEVDEEENPDFRRRLESQHTNRGKRSRVVLRFRPPGSSDAVIHEFEHNTDHEYQEFISENSERQIMKAHGWHTVLLGVPQPGRLGNQSEFKDIYQVKYKTIIQPLQRRVMDAVNRAVDLVAEFFERDDVMEFSLGLSNLFQDMLESSVPEPGADGDQEVAPEEADPEATDELNDANG